MPYVASNTRARKKASRKIIDIHQKSFAKGYISTYANTRRPLDSFSDMTNMEIVQDNIARPRPPLVAYGNQPEAEVTGRGAYTYGGARYILFMLKNTNGIKATGTLTSTGAIANNDTVTIGSTVYTFKTTLTPTAFEVLIGASAAIALDNLKDAINLTGTPGTQYAAATTLHPTVEAATNTDTTQVLQAKTAGVAGNSIATTETGANIAFGAVTLTSGHGEYGAVFKQTDGGTITLVGGVYDSSAWSGFCQSAGKVYIFNGIDKLSYLNLSTGLIVTYIPLATPSAPSGTGSANLISGTKPFNYYYKVTANNAVGESAASVGSTAVNVNSVRDAWSAVATIDKTVTITWSAVTGASSYTLYVGDTQGNEKELITLNALSYTDDGSAAPNPFKLAPDGNSTEGPILTWLYNDSKNSQLFGVGVDNKLYYSSAGATNTSADFSPYNGGGYVAIDPDGSTTLNFVDGFRNGKGDPVITTSSRGAAGKGKLHHVTFETLTIGDQAIVYPNVYEANGQSATYAPRATIKARDSLFYPTGTDFKTTGTSQNIVNILTTTSISQVIEPDLDDISLESLHKAVGVEWKDKGIFALPVGSSENNQIWYIDFARKNLWVLRWTVAAKDLWLYEDSAGLTHFCALVDNKVLEFTRRGSQTTQDDGVPFSTSLGFSSMVWDESGITLAIIYRQYFKLIQPKGTINVNAYGLSKKGFTSNVASNQFSQIGLSFTGYDIWLYDDYNYQYDDDPGQIDTYGKAITVVTLKPKGLINQLDWVITTQDANCDYMLSAVNTRGSSRDTLIYSA